MIAYSIINIVQTAAWIAAIFLLARYIVKRMKQEGSPAGLIAAGILCLLPVLAAPMVLFGSIFMFDNPSDMVRTAICFLLVNSYSLFCVGGFLVSRHTYKKSGDMRRSITCAVAGILLAAGVFVTGLAVAFA